MRIRRLELMKNPARASLYSLLIPGGGGLFYVGQKAKGFWIMIFTIAGFLGYLSFGIAYLFVVTMGAIDARNIARSQGKDVSLSVALSLIFLGAGGHLFLHKSHRGAWFTFAAIATVFPIVGGIFAITLSMVESHRMAIKRNTEGFLEPWDFSWKYKPDKIVRTKWEILDIVEHGRTQAYIGEETRVIDTSKSRSSSINRTINFKKQWRQTYELEYEKAHSLTKGESVRTDRYITYTKQIEDSIKKRYAITGEEIRTCEESIEVDAKPGTIVILRIEWKKILQQGYVEVSNTYDDPSETIQIPFSLVVDLTFDLRVEEN